MMWNKESIHNLLDTNPRAVERALVAIYRRQTADEQAQHATRHSNGIGFSAFDAEFCTDVAQKLISGYYNGLTPKQLAVSRNKMKRYWRQLVEVAEQSSVQPVELVATAAVPTPKRCDCEYGDGEPEAVCPCDSTCPNEREARHLALKAVGIRGTW